MPALAPPQRASISAVTPLPLLVPCARLVDDEGPFDTLVHGVGMLMVKRFVNLSLGDYAQRVRRKRAQRSACGASGVTGDA